VFMNPRRKLRNFWHEDHFAFCVFYKVPEPLPQ
jgi:hypothetical protein